MTYHSVGVNITVVGDILQLGPVNGHYVFDQPPVLSAEEVHLWGNFVFRELTHNMMRQGMDPLLNICNNLKARHNNCR